MKRPLCVAISLLLALTALPARAQSERLSEVSAASLVTLSEVPPAALALIAEGARFSVTALRPVGESVLVVMTAVGEGVSFTVELAASAVAAAGLVIGTVVVGTAVVAGHLLYAGAEAIAFVPNEAARAQMHHRALSR